MIHNLKTWPEFFDAVRIGIKKFELRKDDRNFCVGDLLLLQEYDPGTGRYVSEEGEHAINTVVVSVTYILRGFGIPEDHCVMSIERIGESVCRAVSANG